MAWTGKQLKGVTLIESLVALILISLALSVALVFFTRLSSFEASRSHIALESICDSLYNSPSVHNQFTDHSVISHSIEAEINYEPISENTLFHQTVISLWDNQVMVYSKSYLSEQRK